MTICARCGTENPDTNKFCGECAAPLAAAPAVREMRKTVTVVFCDVTGSTALGERLDPESLRSLLARYFERMREIVEAHGGTVEKFIGDAVMAVFGVPQLHEDDALRAVRAAAEMRDALPELGVAGRLGLATGEVVTGTEERLATGDAVNVAARLEQAAEPGEILIGADTLALVREDVEVDPVGGLAVKGKAEPVEAWRLLDRPARLGAPAWGISAGRPRAPAPPAAGRVRGARGRSGLPPGHAAGSAGVGKSRLVAEFLAGIGARIVRGRCLSYGEGIAYWPAVEVVKQLGSRPADPSAAAAIAVLLAESDDSASPDELAWAVRKLLEQEAASGSLVCVFDDIQWAEPGLLDLIEHVADYSRDAPIMLVCIARPELLDRRPGWAGGKLNTTTILLEPLTPDQTDALIEGLAMVEPELRARIRDAAEGNPLFVEEMLAMVRDSPGREVVVPPTIQALLGARLDQLDGLERAVLERGAVEGKVFHRGAVQALVPDDQQVPQRLMALVRKELVRPDHTQIPGDDAFRFRHLLIRDAAYDALPKAVRAELHERFAVWLGEHGDALVELDEIVGYHFEQACRYRRELGGGAGDSESLAAAARVRLLAAGQRARLVGDSPSAVNLFERAAALEPADTLDLELAFELGNTLFMVGDTGAALEVSRALVAKAGRLGDRVAELCGRIIEADTLNHTDPGVGVQHLERLIIEGLPVFSEAGNHLALYIAYWSLGEVANMSCRADAFLDACNAALEQAERMRRPHLAALLLGSLNSARQFGTTPVPEVLEWLDEQERTHPLDAFNQGTRAAALAMAGRIEEARALVRRAADRALDRGSTIAYALLMSHAATEMEMMGGDPARAVEYSREGCRVLEERGELAWLSTAVGYQARALYELDLPDEAYAQTLRAAELGSDDDIATQMLWRQTQAKVLARRGEHAVAEVLAREAVELCDRTDYPNHRATVYEDLAETLVLCGHADQAPAALARAIELYTLKGNVASRVRAETRRERLRQLT